ncbi:MAG TPA: copper resistance protein NlpE, partial [Sphingobacterium sp.]|nr:copper resistance protein NlpE [Sphingobacterium sp.]
DGESKYKVGEGMMKKLDIEGKEIKGELEEFYNFKKIK